MGVLGSIQGWWRSRRSASGRADGRLAPQVQTAEWDMTRGLDVQQLGVLATAPVSMLPSERLLLYALVYGTRPQRYLEVGTLYGGSAAIVCAALDALELPTRMALVDPEPRVDAQLLSSSGATGNPGTAAIRRRRSRTPRQRPAAALILS